MKRLLLLLVAAPLVGIPTWLFLIFAIPTDFDEFAWDSRNLDDWESVEKLAAKYDLQIGSHSVIFGPSHCSTSARIYREALNKEKKITSYKQLRDDPLFFSVHKHGYHGCHGHRDWPAGMFY